MTEYDLVQRSISLTEILPLHEIIGTGFDDTDNWLVDNWEWVKNYISDIRNSSYGRGIDLVILQNIFWHVMVGDLPYPLIAAQCADRGIKDSFDRGIT